MFPLAFIGGPLDGLSSTLSRRLLEHAINKHFERAGVPPPEFITLNDFRQHGLLHLEVILPTARYESVPFDTMAAMNGSKSPLADDPVIQMRLVEIEVGPKD